MNMHVGVPSALAIDDLTISIGRGNRRVAVVDKVSLRVAPGEVLALVGESGCGKSITAMAVSQLLGGEARIEHGAVHVDGVEVSSLRGRALARARGTRIGFVFQEPMSSLNPLMTIGAQIAEPLVEHGGLTRQAARDRTIDLLRAVGFPAARDRLDDYPHQLSGGQRQRVMIAIAIACRPPLLLADEPTTALDVTTQAQVLNLLQQLRVETGMGMLLITHDLGVVHGIADRVAVMYAGRIVETGSTADVFADPQHPYTRMLLAALPRVTRKVERLSAIEGTPPSPYAFPAGCRFHPRCSSAVEACRSVVPPLSGNGARSVACHLAAIVREAVPA